MNSGNVFLKIEPAQDRGWAVVQRITDVTLELLARDGMDAVNTNVIADMAGITPPSLYRFFANKQAIFAYILENWLSEIQGVYRRYDSDEELLALPWNEFFDSILQEWSVPGNREKTIVWDAIIESDENLKSLDDKHFAQHSRFMFKHFRRLGARGSEAEWETHSYYAYFVQDYVEAMAEKMPKKKGQSLKDFHRRSFVTALEPLFA